MASWWVTTALFALSKCVAAQQDAITPQNNTWNSSFSLSSSQISSANLDEVTVNNVNVAIRFEQSNWATGSVLTDPFYVVPSNANSAPSGSILKVEDYSDTTLYTLPPNVALSRIVYQSATYRLDHASTPIPASAFILWPWQPRIDPATGKYEVVAWAHGTSGIFGECAPSHIRNLWYQYSAPFILALQGYVVIAPDYTGLGVDRWPNGTIIEHPAFNNPSHANDLFYAVEAAQTAYPDELSERFVVFGHSQGGGAAWGAAQRQARQPVEGYLGTIAASPITDIALQYDITPDVGWPIDLVPALSATVPDFDRSDFLTERGERHYDLLAQIGGCASAYLQLYYQGGLVRSGWEATSAMQEFQHLTGNGGRPISGPMLVLQGTGDVVISANLTTHFVNETCALYPDSEIEYAVFEGADHVPTLYASQRIWLGWIAERFEGKPVKKGCEKRETYRPARRIGTYQKELAYYLEFATQSYEVA
jgi:pimeloyl-ACP methyl ester carboxylesterase